MSDPCVPSREFQPRTEEDPDGQASPHRRRGRPGDRGRVGLARRVADRRARLVAPPVGGRRADGRAPHRTVCGDHPGAPARTRRVRCRVGRVRLRRDAA
ncbi:hypothetical protein CURTO8I2_190017 [Curtobacterium sp. 8I-2]|nr:hypothetical protein CURTO8I2_190017 [Curtobacterium sp. 8I-2]